MNNDIDFLHLDSTMSEIAVVINRTDKKIGFVAIVDNLQQLNLVGSV